MKAKQQGAVLILTLVVILVLTLYGVVSTRDAKTQFQIAGNMQSVTQALSDAEGVLTKMENTVKCLRDTDEADDDDFPVDFSGYPSGEWNTYSLISPAGCTVGDEKMNASDMSNNQIFVVFDTSEWKSVEVDSNGDGDCNFIFRSEEFIITVTSNNPRGGRREVRSTYVATSRENCHL